MTGADRGEMFAAAARAHSKAAEDAEAALQVILHQFHMANDRAIAAWQAATASHSRAITPVGRGDAHDQYCGCDECAEADANDLDIHFARMAQVI